MPLATVLLQKDFDALVASPLERATAPSLVNHPDLHHWALSVRGADGTSWQGLDYDVELRWSRRHPFEPPLVCFPLASPRNVRNPRHSAVDPATGHLCLHALSFDGWRPVLDAREVLSTLVLSLFSEDPTGDRMSDEGSAGEAAEDEAAADDGSGDTLPPAVLRLGTSKGPRVASSSPASISPSASAQRRSRRAGGYDGDYVRDTLARQQVPAPSIPADCP